MIPGISNGLLLEASALATEARRAGDSYTAMAVSSHAATSAARLGAFDDVSWFCDPTRWACTVGEADSHWSSVTDFLPHRGPLPAWLLLQRATAALHVGDVQAAVEAVDRVSQVLETCDVAAPLLDARALVIRARCSLAVGATSDAQTNGHAAIILAVNHRLVLVQIDALEVIADIALARHNSRLARQLDAACDAHRRRIGYVAGFTALRFKAGADATARSCAVDDRVLSLGEAITLARRAPTAFVRLRVAHADRAVGRVVGRRRSNQRRGRRAARDVAGNRQDPPHADVRQTRRRQSDRARRPPRARMSHACRSPVPAIPRGFSPRSRALS